MCAAALLACVFGPRAAGADPQPAAPASAAPAAEPELDPEEDLESARDGSDETIVLHDDAP